MSEKQKNEALIEEAQIVTDDEPQTNSEDTQSNSEPIRNSPTQSTAVSLSQQLDNAQLTKLDSFTSVQDIITFVQDIGVAGTPQKIAQIILRGKELGVPPMASFDNIYILPSGKATLSGHLINALARRSGVEFQTIYDNWYLNRDGSVTQMRNQDFDANGNVIASAKSKMPNVSIDRICEIKVFRKSNLMTDQYGKPVVLTDTVRYHWSEVVAAKLNDKDTYKAYGNQIFWLRTLVFALRRYAPEALLGMYEFSELADIENVGYRMDDGGMPAPK